MADLATGRDSGLGDGHPSGIPAVRGKEARVGPRDPAAGSRCSRFLRFTRWRSTLGAGADRVAHGLPFPAVPVLPQTKGGWPGCSLGPPVSAVGGRRPCQVAGIILGRRVARNQGGSLPTDPAPPAHLGRRTPLNEKRGTLHSQEMGCRPGGPLKLPRTEPRLCPWEREPATIPQTWGSVPGVKKELGASQRTWRPWGAGRPATGKPADCPPDAVETAVPGFSPGRPIQLSRR